MEHEKNTRSKLGGVSSRGKGGEENVKTSESTDREKIATSRTMARYAACMPRVQNDSLFHYCGIVLAFQQIAFFFHIVFDIINTRPTYGKFVG